MDYIMSILRAHLPVEDFYKAEPQAGNLRCHLLANLQCNFLHTTRLQADLEWRQQAIL